MPLPPALRQDVLRWIEEDPDPKTREELTLLIEDDDETELTDRFSGLLRFGTAGLRGLLGGGPNRMNRALVQRATAGLCQYLLETVPDAKARGVVIGYDARRMSLEFAQDVATVVGGYGLKAYVFPHLAPTPLVGFAVLDQNAAAGVVITASHNPPDYNGYKVFWGNGAQIIPPHDRGIASRIERIESLASIPRNDAPLVLGPEVRARYLEGVLAVQRQADLKRDLTLAYTAMHGVGGEFIAEVFKRAGFEHLHHVAAQETPDGEFPTVTFPNPEEDGAMDLVLAEAKAHHAELILANDPDADRLAASVLHDGQYVPLTGNEIGCLLAHYILENGEGGDRLVICSVVSSPMLIAIGKAHGVHAEQTLTGHKWIQNRGLELERTQNLRMVFGYEEALGYACGTLVRDKDGISAALLLADMAVWCKEQSRTLIDELELMGRRYGLYLSDQRSMVLPGKEGRAAIKKRMQDARRAPPESLGGLAVTASLDFDTGLRTTADGQSPLSFPKSNVLLFELEGGHRAMLRPSGTEPKIKHYIDVRVDMKEGENAVAARARGSAILKAIARDFVSE